MFTFLKAAWAYFGPSEVIINVGTVRREKWQPGTRYPQGLIRVPYILQCKLPPNVSR